MIELDGGDGKGHGFYGQSMIRGNEDKNFTLAELFGLMNCA